MCHQKWVWWIGEISNDFNGSREFSSVNSKCKCNVDDDDEADDAADDDDDNEWWWWGWWLWRWWKLQYMWYRWFEMFPEISQHFEYQATAIVLWVTLINCYGSKSFTKIMKFIQLNAIYPRDLYGSTHEWCGFDTLRSRNLQVLKWVVVSKCMFGVKSITTPLWSHNDSIVTKSTQNMKANMCK